LSKYLTVGLSALILFGLCGFLIKTYGRSEYDRGYVTALASINEATVQKTRQNAKNTQVILKLNDNDLVRRYCSFVYGVTYDECVRTVKPLD